MLRATGIVRKPAVKSDRVVDRVVLDHEGRSRRRIALTAEGGLEFLLDLDKATSLADGDALKLEDGRLVLVKAAPQRLLEIRAENPLRLIKVAYHVGNRHVPLQVVLQQTPSTQFPLTHSVLPLQVCPSIFSQLLAPSHAFGETQMFAGNVSD